MTVVSFAPRPLRLELKPTVPTYYGKRFSFLQQVQTDSGARPVSVQWVEVALSMGMKRSGCDADHLSPSSAEIKNEHSYTSSSSTCLHIFYMYTFTMSPIEKYDKRTLLPLRTDLDALGKRLLPFPVRIAKVV